MAKKQIRRLSLLFALLLVLFNTLSFTGAAADAVTVGALGSPDTEPTLPTDREITAARSALCASAVDTSNLRVHVGGMPFGVKFMTDGIFVVGFCDVKTKNGTSNPAKEAGLRIGDVVLGVNGKRIESAAALTNLVESGGGQPITLLCRRDGHEFECRMTPACSVEEGRYKTGIYVRDSGAGIGTVTFILPESYAFAGLGHGICDAESGKLIPMERGSVVDVTISGLVKGLSGAPGEVKGYFRSGKTGTLLGNTECGVYGVMAKLPEQADQKTVALGTRNEVKEGKAYLCASLDGNAVKQYEIEISDIRRDSTSNKCYTVKVTDKELLSKTGGIIQGMSGSPIIQDGHLIGAVTHVLIGDPTTGYGIFIENMLSQMGDLAG